MRKEYSSHALEVLLFNVLSFSSLRLSFKRLVHLQWGKFSFANAGMMKNSTCSVKGTAKKLFVKFSKANRLKEVEKDLISHTVYFGICLASFRYEICRHFRTIVGRSAMLYLVSLSSSLFNNINNLKGRVIMLKMASARGVGGRKLSSSKGGIRLSHRRLTRPK